MTDPVANSEGPALGKRLWGAHLVWSELLRNWCEAQGKDSLSAIAFDKLCLLSGLIWGHLARSGLVSFTFPYVPGPGKHGHGPKLCTDPESHRQPFVVTVLGLWHLALPRFARNVYSLKPEPKRSGDESGVKRVLSELLEGDIDSYSGDDLTLTTQERDFVSQLCVVIGQLSADEIRVLAVHSGFDRTLEAIEYNASFWYSLTRNSVSAIPSLRAHTP